MVHLHNQQNNETQGLKKKEEKETGNIRTASTVLHNCEDGKKISKSADYSCHHIGVVLSVSWLGWYGKTSVKQKVALSVCDVDKLTPQC
ncbi:hypothetical protein GN956_G7195 [Arapaima gigas]